MKNRISNIETWIDIYENGKIIVNNKQQYDENIKLLHPGRYLHSIKRVQNIRSLDQNNSMWGIPYMFYRKALIESGEFINPSNNQIHEWCMLNCLPEDYRERIYAEWKEEQGSINYKTGEVYKSPFRLTTTKMTTVDAMHYYENMQNNYADWFGNGNEKNQIPDPDPKLKRRNNKSKIVENFEAKQ